MTLTTRQRAHFAAPGEDKQAHVDRTPLPHQTPGHPTAASSPPVGAHPVSCLLSALALLLPAASQADYGNPTLIFNTLQNPEILATRAQAAADLQRMMAQKEAFLVPEQGTDCTLTFEDAQRAMMGPEKYDEHQASWRSQGVEPPVALSYRLTMLSGNCPENGRFQGQVEYGWQAETEITTGTDYASRTTTLARTAAVYDNGTLAQGITSYASNAYTSYTVLTSGERIKIKYEGSPPSGPTYSVTYPNGQNGLPTDTSVTYTLLDMPANIADIGNHFITITRHLDKDRILVETYQNGKLFARSKLKNGRLHGWVESLNINVRQCYQNGLEIKSLECPDT